MKMKRALLIIALAAASSLSASAQATLQQRITNDVKRSPALNGAGVGVIVKDMDGNTLAAVNADQRFVPASNTKLITTGTALHSLGPDYRFKTAIGYTGTISNGSLDGDIYIIGGGDPTLGPMKKTSGASLIPNGWGFFSRRESELSTDV